MSGASSLGKSTAAKDICILLVNDDYICRNIVADMLERCSYEAFSYEGEIDALNMIWEKKDVTELILTNVHRSADAKRHDIIKNIEEHIKLKIILIYPTDDDIKLSTVGGKGVSVYYMKCLSVDEMNNLLATALGQLEKNKNESSSGSKSKRMRDDDIDDQNGNKEKKQRVIWTKEKHQKFLEVVAQLGEDKAFPKKIVELMNDPTLTRANVASHLQKHRTCMKRAKEGPTGSYNDNFGFNILQGNFQQPQWNPFQMGLGNTHFNYNYSQSRSRIMPQSLSLLNTIRMKPDFHNFSVYNDDTKNILLTSTEDNRVHPNPNTSFAGFRFARDGKSVVFGQNYHLPLPVPQQDHFSDMDSTHCPQFQQSSVALQEIGSGSVSMNTQMSSLAALLAVDEPMTQLQPSAASLAFDWDGQLKFPCEQQQQQQQQQQMDVMTPQQSAGLQFTNGAEPLSISSQQSSHGIMGESVSISSQLSSLLAVGEPMPATMTQLQPSAASLSFDWDEQPKFTCEQQQQAGMTLPQSTRLQFTDEAEPSGISLQQPPSTNAISDIFGDFTRSLSPELGAVGDDNGVDATAKKYYEDLLFDNYELTKMKERLRLRESNM